MQSTTEFRFDCERMFELVADIEHYPDFLPAWRFVEVRRRTERAMEVRQVVRMAGFRLEFESAATLERPRRIAITTGKSSFEYFEIEWRFEPRCEGCSVTLAMRAAMRNRLVDRVLAPALARHQGQIARCFEAEAERRYGGTCTR